MILQSCPRCYMPDSVEEDPSKDGGWTLADTCTCAECGARFEIDADADYDGESYRDCSTVGKPLV